jgi:hypothetical protein
MKAYQARVIALFSLLVTAAIVLSACQGRIP